MTVRAIAVGSVSWLAHIFMNTDYRNDETIDQQSRSRYELADAVNRLALILEKRGVCHDRSGDGADKRGGGDHDVEPENTTTKPVAAG